MSSEVRHAARGERSVADAPARQQVAPWVSAGIVSGLVGAFTVAAFFLVVDVLRGQPLWTPAALGSSLFLGQKLADGASAPFALVVGYTAVHGVVFLALGAITAFVLANAPSRRDTVTGFLLLTAALFAAYEAVFLGFAFVFDPDLVARLGTGLVAGANALAAALMGGYLTYAVGAPAVRAPEDPGQG